jgi:DNA-binding transcriptional ArsR family regulator
MSTAAARTRQSKKEDQLDLVFTALSNRTRRAMLASLGEGPSMITDLASPHKMSLPAVSKHLRVLERAGLVRRSINGRVHRCSLDTMPLRKIEDWLSYYRSFWEETLDALARHVEESD